MQRQRNWGESSPKAGVKVTSSWALRGPSAHWWAPQQQQLAPFWRTTLERKACADWRSRLNRNPKICSNRNALLTCMHHRFYHVALKARRSLISDNHLMKFVLMFCMFLCFELCWSFLNVGAEIQFGAPWSWVHLFNGWTRNSLWFSFFLDLLLFLLNSLNVFNALLYRLQCLYYIFDYVCILCFVPTLVLFAKKHLYAVLYIYIMIFLCYYINIEWTTLRPMAFMFRPENHCSLQLLFATMNQDGEVWSWTIISRIVPRWNYFSMHCFVSFLWPKSKVACLGFPVLTNVLRCPGDRVPVECCVKVNDLQLNGCYISNREALSVLQPQAMGRNPINLTMSIPRSRKVPWVFSMSVFNRNFFWGFHDPHVSN